ncbi:MAG: hypothetical protein Q7T55_01480, partial [Solirubrobacteraceae bacterium]|nr:hypothetical protein [Solirubrobacteraceae bacterium]
IVFRMIFEVFNIFAVIGNFVGIISDTSLLQVQIYLLTPLILIDKFIGLIFFIIGFIITKGLIWFVAICEMLMFIFAYGKGKPSIMATLTNFVNYNKSFYHNIGILLTWIYEKLFLKLVELVRG